MSMGALEKMTNELLGQAVTEFGLFDVRYEITFRGDEEEPHPQVVVYEDLWGIPDGDCLAWFYFNEKGAVEFKRADHSDTEV